MKANFPIVGSLCLGFWLFLYPLGTSGCHFSKTKSPIGQTSVVRACLGAKDDLPSFSRTRIGQCLIFTDEELPDDKILFESLEKLPLELARELGIPPQQKWVKVYIFSDSQSFRNYLDTTYPGLPKRRAYFFAKKRAGGLAEEMQVLTLRSDRLLQDLRHEITHAMLHSAFGTVPLWIDEGIAEYFENEPNCLGLNRAHLGDIQSDWRAGRIPNLKRLESLTSVNQMGREEYRESWAWIYWLIRLHPGGKDMIQAYLADKAQPTKAVGFVQILESEQNDFEFQMMEMMSRVDIPEPGNSISKRGGSPP